MFFVFQAFCRHSSKNPSEQRTLYLHSVCKTAAFLNHYSSGILYLQLYCYLFVCVQVLTHRLGSAAMLSLVYAEILKMFRIWGILNFDVEIFFPHDSSSNPRGYIKQKSKESDQAHIMTTESLLVKVHLPHPTNTGAHLHVLQLAEHPCLFHYTYLELLCF